MLLINKKYEFFGQLFSWLFCANVHKKSTLLPNRCAKINISNNMCFLLFGVIIFSKRG